MLSFLFWSTKIKIKNIRQLNENKSRKNKTNFFQKNILAKNLALIFLHFILTAPLNSIRYLLVIDYKIDKFFFFRRIVPDNENGRAALDFCVVHLFCNIMFQNKNKRNFFIISTKQ
jgi:hypothetical protein